MLTEHDKELIHDFLFNLLKGDKLEEFNKRLEIDEEFKKEYLFKRDIKSLADKVVKERRVQNALNILANTKAKYLNYTEQERRSWFAPLNRHEKKIHNQNVFMGGATEKQTKSFNINVLSPQNEENVEGDIIQFQFAGTAEFEILLIIKDNKDKELSRITIPSGTTELSLDLTTENITRPGRYYWRMQPTDRKIPRQYNSLIRVFFIRKDLMPPHL